MTTSAARAVRPLLLLSILAMSCDSDKARAGAPEMPPVFQLVDRQELPEAWGMSVFHDDRRQVTCWLYKGGTVSSPSAGLSCIPDRDLRPLPKE